MMVRFHFQGPGLLGHTVTLMCFSCSHTSTCLLRFRPAKDAELWECWRQRFTRIFTSGRCVRLKHLSLQRATSRFYYGTFVRTKAPCRWRGGHGASAGGRSGSVQGSSSPFLLLIFSFGLLLSPLFAHEVPGPTNGRANLQEKPAHLVKKGIRPGSVFTSCS